MLEHEALALAQALGIGVPRHLLVTGSAVILPADLEALPGDRVVVKVVSPHILHKSDAGGVAVVPRDRSAVVRAVREMEVRFAGQDVAGYLLEEFVAHDDALGGELLLGLRWTADFGPVVTFGFGGVHAEFMARHLAAGHDVAIVSPALRAREQIARALDGVAAPQLLTQPQRGQPARMREADLVDLLARFLDFAATAEEAGIGEFEINPLVLTGGGPVALDALARALPRAATPAAPRPLERIARLLKPRSIAVIGVSEGMNPGRIILRNVLRDGFDADAVYVVKPGATSIDGCRCVPDVASLPSCVDLLVVSVGAAQAAAAVEDAIRLHKAESLILIPGGMGERGDAAGHVDRMLGALAAARREPWRGPVISGPNSLGIRSRPGRYNTLFIPDHKLHFPAGDASPLAVLTQSGALAVAWASKLGRLNPRYLITLGNQLDLTMADVLEYLEQDPAVRVFVCYVEGFQPGDGARWLRTAARLTAAGRPVLLYRAGRTAAGAQAMASHTASIAGDYAVCRALARTAGVVVADTLADLTDLSRLFCLLADKEVMGLRLAAVSNAGFECVAMADAVGPFTLAPWSDATRGAIGRVLARARIADIVTVRNPLDLTPILNDAGYEEVAAAVLADEGVDVGVIGCVPLTGALNTLPPGAEHGEDIGRADSVVRRLARLHAASRKAWVAVVDAGAPYDPMAEALETAGVPTFRTADRALAMFARYCEWRLAGR
jgi:acyl-CoA synthetase (NDP forming)